MAEKPTAYIALIKKMNRNKKGQWLKEINEPVLMSFYIEYADRNWLREQALKKKTTISNLIRYYIAYFMKKDRTGQVKG